MIRRAHGLAAAAALALAAAPATRAADLSITVAGVLAGRGDVLVALFDQAEGFPDKVAPSQPARRVRPVADTVSVSFTGLSAGRWAVMVLQDLNGNGRADTNLLGLPVEPYGASNNRLPRLAPPRFDDAVVELGPQGAAIRIELRRP